MQISEARTNLMNYYDISNPTESDRILYVESLEFLIDKTRDPEYMSELAFYYCADKRFDLEIKYLEMATEYGDLRAYEELGYMYYYGQHGVQDYKRAFECFSKGAEGSDGEGRMWCKFKLADMYRFGCYVDKDEKKYREIIEDLYKKITSTVRLSAPLPEISLRLAGIRAEDGDRDEAIRLLRTAKPFMAERLSYDPFWGHIEVMGRIVRFLYDLTPIDEADMDFYDLFSVTRECRAVSFKRNGTEYHIDISDDDEHALRFGGKWYRDFEELCNKAEIDGERVTAIYDEFYEFETRR